MLELADSNQTGVFRIKYEVENMYRQKKIHRLLIRKPMFETLPQK